MPVPGGCWAVGVPQVLGMSLRVGTAPWLLPGVVPCVSEDSRELSPHAGGVGSAVHPPCCRMLDLLHLPASVPSAGDVSGTEELSTSCVLNPCGKEALGGWPQPQH